MKTGNAVDQALRIFKPDIEVDDIKPKPLPPRQAAHKGEVSRIVLATLRDAKRACTTQELTMHVMAERGLANGGPYLGGRYRNWINGCGNKLDRYRRPVQY